MVLFALIACIIMSIMLIGCGSTGGDDGQPVNVGGDTINYPPSTSAPAPAPAPTTPTSTNTPAPAPTSQIYVGTSGPAVTGPSITSITPDRGPSGTTVTVNVVNFYTNIVGTNPYVGIGVDKNNDGYINPDLSLALTDSHRELYPVNVTQVSGTQFTVVIPSLGNNGKVYILTVTALGVSKADFILTP